MHARRLRWSDKIIGPLAQNPSHVFAARHALVHWPSGAVATFIPKNGCSTLRLSLAIANGCIDTPEQHTWIHANNQTFVATPRELVTAPYTFVVLRDPLDRLASAYLDKIVDRTVEAWQLVDKLDRKVELSAITFERFVQFMASPAIRKSNVHWREQSDFLVFDKYDDYFLLDNLSVAIEKIRESCGLQLVDGRDKTRHGRDGYLEAADIDRPFELSPNELFVMKHFDRRVPAISGFYTDELREMATEAYRSDVGLISVLRGGSKPFLAPGNTHWITP